MESVATFTHRLFTGAAITFMNAEGDGPLALHSALATILDEIAGAPEMAYASVIELPRIGLEARERHAAMIDLFGELLATGLRDMGEPPPNADTMALCLAGSVWEAIRRHTAQGRLHELPDALPAISHVCISTLYGLDEARRVSASARGVHRPSAHRSSTSATPIA
jgi:hypothetical protein